MLLLPRHSPAEQQIHAAIDNMRVCLWTTASSRTRCAASCDAAPLLVIETHASVIVGDYGGAAAKLLGMQQLLLAVAQRRWVYCCCCGRRCRCRCCWHDCCIVWMLLLVMLLLILLLLLLLQLLLLTDRREYCITFPRHFHLWLEVSLLHND